jgi:hypothetical protein
MHLDNKNEHSYNSKESNPIKCPIGCGGEWLCQLVAWLTASLYGRHMAESQQRIWFTTATGLRAAVARLPHGKREEGLKRIAAQNGWSAQTLRRAMTALAFLDRLESETKIRAKNLARFPVAAIEYAARIYRRNPDDAQFMLKELVAGRINVAQLKEHEEQTRDQSPIRSGKSLEFVFRQEAAPAIARIVGEELKQLDVNAFFDPRSFIDFISASHDWRTAVLIVGPYQDPALYGKRAFDWIAKANALLPLFERVFLILPSNADVGHFTGWVHSLRISDDRLRLAQLGPDASTQKLHGSESFGVEDERQRR